MPTKVQGHAELEIEKPRVKTLSYDFPKLQHSKTNSFCANVLKVSVEPYRFSNIP